MVTALLTVDVPNFELHIAKHHVSPHEQAS